MGKAEFRNPVKDFYLTNPIARASSQVMAELSAMAKARAAPADGGGMIMQMVRATSRAIVTGSLAGLMACAQGPVAEGADAGSEPCRIWITARADVTLMGGDLVRVQVAHQRRRTEQEQIDSYARCVVAGYALKNNAGFARHVRTDDRQ